MHRVGYHYLLAGIVSSLQCLSSGVATGGSGGSMNRGPSEPCYATVSVVSPWLWRATPPWLGASMQLPSSACKIFIELSKYWCSF